MSHKPLFFFIFLIICSNSRAQTVNLDISLIYPRTDSSAGATIQIFRLPDSTMVQARVGRPGKNHFPVLQHTSYWIDITGIGLETVHRKVSIDRQSMAVSIALRQSQNALKEVTVISRKPLLRQEDDKTLVDAETLAASSTNAYEVLEKAPGIVIDQDGNVYLSSSAAATIYINGRQMRMSNDDIAALLKSLPAGSINRIEIIRTPSTKYDAANSGGIVNIVLKKGIRIGTTGSANIRYDQGVYGTASAGCSINNSTGPLSSWFSYQYTNRKSFDDIRSQRQISGDTLLTQSSLTRYSNTTHYIGAGLAWSVGNKIELAYDLRLTANDNTSHAVSSNEFGLDKAGTTYYRSETPIVNKGKPLLVANALTAKYKFDSVGSEWSAEIDYTHNNTGYTQSYTNNYILPENPSVMGDGTLHAPSAMLDLKTDLLLKLPHRWQIETGFKQSDVANRNEAAYYTRTDSSALQPDTYQTNTFHYNENISSGYLQLTRTIGSLILKGGVRYEHTDITGHQFIPSDTGFSIHRGDFFPYFYVRRPLFSIFGYPLTGNITWRRSITRPGYDALNPSPKFVDPYTFNVGNTSLRPQFTTNYEINATYNDFPVFAVGINDTKNIFSQVTYQHDGSDIAYRTWDNLGRYKEVYGRLFGGLPAGGKYFMYAGVQFNHIHYIGEYQGAPLDYRRASWTFFSGHELKLGPLMKINLNGWMYVNGFRMFNELKPLGQLNASFTRTFFNKKLSLVVSGADLLYTNKSTFHLQQSGVLVNGVRTQDSRRFGITCRYNFGFSHREEKKEMFPQPPPTQD